MEILRKNSEKYWYISSRSVEIKQKIKKILIRNTRTFVFFMNVHLSKRFWKEYLKQEIKEIQLQSFCTLKMNIKEIKFSISDNLNCSNTSKEMVWYTLLRRHDNPVTEIILLTINPHKLLLEGVDYLMR